MRYSKRLPRRTLFEIVLFEDCANQWSLSRPMLSLILVNEQYFPELRAQITVSQPADRQAKLVQGFDKLMADVTRSLEPKNRDKFTQVRAACNPPVLPAWLLHSGRKRKEQNE